MSLYEQNARDHDEADRLIDEARANPPRHRGYAWHTERENDGDRYWDDHYAVSPERTLWLINVDHIETWSQFCAALDAVLDGDAPIHIASNYVRPS